MVKKSLTFEEAVAPLDTDKKKLAAGLHERALALGYIPFIEKAGKKDGNFKIEYKVGKKTYVLFISRISKNDLSVGCKLLYLSEYIHLIDELNETVRNELLASRPCKVDKGCTAYVSFCFEHKDYLICRHAMRLKTLNYADLQGLWKLLEAEDSQRKNNYTGLRQHENYSTH